MPAPRTNGRPLAKRNYPNSMQVDITQALSEVNYLVSFFTGSEVADAMQKVIDVGVKTMQESILNPIPERDAPFSSLARQLGVNKGPGRYRTGAMYRSVGGRLQRGPKTIKLVVGYLKGKIEKYFKLQDRGFRNLWKLVAVGEGYNGRVSSGPNAPRGLHFEPRATPKWTEGTYAVRNAKQAMIDTLPKAINSLKTKYRKKSNKVGG